MSYIPTNIVPISSSSSKCFDTDAPKNGLLLESGKSKLGDKWGFCTQMSNVIPCGDGLCGMKKGQDIFSDMEKLGTYHAGTSSCFRGNNLFHIGTSLYVLSQDGEVFSIADNLPDKDGMFCTFFSALYYYCDGYIFMTDKDFNCTKLHAYAPLMFSVNSTGLVTRISESDGAVFNLASPRITVEYSTQDNHTYEFPIKCDINRDVEINVQGQILDPSEYVVKEDSVRIKTFSLRGPIQISYYFDTTKANDYDLLFEGCTQCIGFGGDTISGTRIFASGNAKRPGEYCVSRVKDPLYFPQTSIETVGDGCDNVTGFLRVYSDLVIFTEGSIHKMSYLFKDGEWQYSIKLINNTVGCDIPKSIALIDNRAVFANTKGGVYIVYSEEETGENNVKQISGNINFGNAGLLECSYEDLTSAVSVEYDGKYILSAGNEQYIWDYSACSYRNSADYGSSQGRLIWYKLSLGKMTAFFEGRNVFYGYLNQQGISSFGTNEQGTNQALSWSFTTDETRFSLPFSEKYVTYIKPDLELSGKAKVKLSLYADGEKYYEKDIYTQGDMRVEIKLPKKALYGFAFGFECDEGTDFHYRGARLGIEII